MEPTEPSLTLPSPPENYLLGALGYCHIDIESSKIGTA